MIIVFRVFKGMGYGVWNFKHHLNLFDYLGLQLVVRKLIMEINKKLSHMILILNDYYLTKLL